MTLDPSILDSGPQTPDVDRAAVAEQLSADLDQLRGRRSSAALDHIANLDEAGDIYGLSPTSRIVVLASAALDRPTLEAISSVVSPRGATLGTVRALIGRLEVLGILTERRPGEWWIA